MLAQSRSLYQDALANARSQSSSSLHFASGPRPAKMPPKKSAGAVKRHAAPASSSAQPAAKVQKKVAMNMAFFRPRDTASTAQQC